MDFGFLFDPTRKLFSIGFRVLDGALDASYYDLLASEARLTSFLAIAKGDVPPDHWFRLGRALTPVGRGSALVSWSGSMFEYLMPALVMRRTGQQPAGPDQSTRRRPPDQYAAELGVPWGISESGFNARDLDQTYQYSSFGVPGLGLKRGLSEDVVIAPYATALAAMIDPEAAVRNFARLSERRRAAAGTASARRSTTPPGGCPRARRSRSSRATWPTTRGWRWWPSATSSTTASMVERFHADPIVEATELLLQERMPRNVLVARTTRRGGEERGRRSRPRAADPAPVHTRLTTRSRGRTCCRTGGTR